MTSLKQTVGLALRRTAIVAAATACLVGATATSAAAAFGNSPHLDSVSIGTSCNMSSRSIFFMTKIVLNQTYAPYGAWVSFNFAFYKVDTLGRPSSQVYYWNGSQVSTNPSQGWSNHVFVNPASQAMNAGFVPGGATTLSNTYTYNGGSVTWNDRNTRIDTQVNVRVWTTSGWVESGWLNVDSYATSVGDSTGGFYPDLSYCLVSY
jgi:hypothetical protein